MTGLEIFLLTAGIIIMVVSFLFGEQLDRKNSANASLDEEQIKSTVKSHVDNAVLDVIDDTVEKTAIELDKLSNEKIMAVSDYSEGVLSEIAKNHEEVMFLYSMLNDKEEQIKDTVKDVEMLKASIKKMVKEGIAKQTGKQTKKQPEKQSDRNIDETEEEKENTKESVKTVKQPEEKQHSEKEKEELSETNNVEQYDGTEILEEQMNNNQRILSLYQNGMSNIDIAKELNLGLGEVRLVIDLYKTRGNL